MYKKTNKIFNNITLCITIFALIAHPIMAADINIPSDTSALIIDFQSPSITPIADLKSDDSATSAADIISPTPAIETPTPAAQTIIPTLIPAMETINSLPDQQSLSATIKQPSQLLPFTRKNYNSNEKVQTRVLNSEDNKLQYTLKYNNLPVKIPINKSRSLGSNDLLLTINPLRVFQPGKYQLEITDLKEINQKQEFTWGILGLDTDKSIYSPQDEARIGISVSDEKGIPICDAHLTLRIESPDTGSNENKTEILTTADKSISVNPACQKHRFDQNPDYLATVNLPDIGIYNLELSARTKNGQYSTTDTIEVRENLPFTVIRQSPQRIYSPEK